MKNKRNTGLRAGVYQESSKKSVLFDLLASVLIFLAFAAIGYTISGFAAMLWLLGAGALTCIAAAAIRHFKKMKLMLPILLAALLLVVLFARNPASGRRKKVSSCRLQKQTALAFGWPGSWQVFCLRW